MKKIVKVGLISVALLLLIAGVFGILSILNWLVLRYVVYWVVPVIWIGVVVAFCIWFAFQLVTRDREADENTKNK